MDNRLKQKVSKMFHSCRPKDTVDDVSDHPFFFPENPHHRQQLIELFSPKPQSFSTPKPPKTFNKTTSFPPKTECRKPEKATKKKPHHRKPKKNQDFSSFTDNYYYDWRSSDEEDESDDGATMFSSRSLSSESSGNFRRNRAHRRSRKKPIATGGSLGDCGCKNPKTSDVTQLEDGGKLVKDSFAVVKKSSNPHEDFRVSMVEMIVEKQIFGEDDLEDLLRCFILLNSEEHHRVIFEVFTEIWETLFSDSV